MIVLHHVGGPRPQGGSTFRSRGAHLRIGRSDVALDASGQGTPNDLYFVDPSQADGPLPDPVRQISKLHAEIVFHQGCYELRDCGSSNGTFLNNRPLSGPERLRKDDEIRLGRTGPRLAVDFVWQAPPTTPSQALWSNPLAILGAVVVAVLLVLGGVAVLLSRL
ncbi:MAG: FHA domain-containing protein [Alphaproteobacteria bacterium]|nr:FHA domain-containing protein [Alphaproteobacteria bacterium]